MEPYEIMKGDFFEGVYGKARVKEITADGHTIYLDDHTVVHNTSLRPTVITADILNEGGYIHIQHELNKNAWYKEYHRKDTGQVFKITITINDKYEDIRPVKIQSKFEKEKRYEGGLVTNVSMLSELQHILWSLKLKEKFGDE